MPILGQNGYISTGNIGTELTNVTRRACIPKNIIQIGQSSPLIAALLANNKMATGGINSITVFPQGSSMVSGSWTGPDASFPQPAMQQGISEAGFNLKSWVVPVATTGYEQLTQDKHAIIDLMMARMNDVGNVSRDALANALYSNASNNMQMSGLPAAVDDGTNLASYGGINRSVNTWWKSKRTAASAANATRATVLQYIIGTVKFSGGERPTFGVMGCATWAGLAQDFLGQETYQTRPGEAFDGVASGPRAGFQALVVGGIPIYMDAYCPEGSLYLLNTQYMSIHIHEGANFHFTGFESTLAQNQLGSIGAVITLLEMVNVKPRASSTITGFTYPTI